jgi:hypothetical protein
MNLKSQIMAAIEQRLTNKQIVELVPTTLNYVVRVRIQYNEIAPEPIRSPVQDKPKQGTASRLVYDYLTANPEALPGEIKQATGVDYGIIYSVRKLFFGHKPRVNKWIAQPVAMQTVELSELAA